MNEEALKQTCETLQNDHYLSFEMEPRVWARIPNWLIKTDANPALLTL